MLPVGWQRRFDGVFAEKRPLGPLTTWRIGGPAELFFEPASAEAAAGLCALLRRSGVPYRVLGGGSNLLIGDRGVPGAVLSLQRLQGLSRSGDRIEVEAGVRLHQLVRFAAAQGLSGAEPLAGIPGRVGGALFGNAGGRYGDIGRLVERLLLATPSGEVVTVRPEEGFFTYRRSQVGDRVVLSATLKLRPESPATAREETLRILRERRSSQPGWVGNAGCVFKNPPGESAGRLIDGCGLKGARAGGIVVSRLHANFFENLGGGTCDDVDRLIERVKDAVRRERGIELEEEVRRWTS